MHHVSSKRQLNGWFHFSLLFISLHEKSFAARDKKKTKECFEMKLFLTFMRHKSETVNLNEAE